MNCLMICSFIPFQCLGVRFALLHSSLSFSKCKYLLFCILIAPRHRVLSDIIWDIQHVLHLMLAGTVPGTGCAVQPGRSCGSAQCCAAPWCECGMGTASAR